MELEHHNRTQIAGGGRLPFSNKMKYHPDHGTLTNLGKGGGAAVFVSHTGQDNNACAFASHLDQQLRDRGIETFIDATSIRAGEEWQKMIRDNVERCSIFVAILSPTYFRRYWCMHELALAISHERRIIPVYYLSKGKDDFNRLNQNKRDFFDKFKDDSRISLDELEEWWNNIKKVVPKYHGLFLSNYPHKFQDRDLKNQLVEEIHQYLFHSADPSKRDLGHVQPSDPPAATERDSIKWFGCGLILLLSLFICLCLFLLITVCTFNEYVKQTENNGTNAHTDAKHPSASPFYAPSMAQSVPPSATPSHLRSVSPSLCPSAAPSEQSPTALPRLRSVPPSLFPSAAPFERPPETPQRLRSVSPSLAPSVAPFQQNPELTPQVPSVSPSLAPLAQPLEQPSETPPPLHSVSPSLAPSAAPSEQIPETPPCMTSVSPSFAPSAAPSKQPSQTPTLMPSSAPTSE